MKERYAERFREILLLSNKRHIELNNTYCVAQWSRTPMSDGNFVYEQNITDAVCINGVYQYHSSSNYRVYYAYQIYETEEEAKDVACFMNELGYESENIRRDILKELGVYKYTRS